MAKELLPRGFRNNNPLNIRKGSNWKGLSSVQGDKSFCVFSSMRYGVRAGIYLLLKYYKKYQLHTLYDLIFRWAPPTENNTYNYCAIVAHHLEIPVDLIYTIDLDLSNDYITLHKLVEAMIFVENGRYLNISSEEFYDILSKEIPSFLK